MSVSDCPSPCSIAVFNSLEVKIGTHNQPITKHNNHNQSMQTAWLSDVPSPELARGTKESARVRRNAMANPYNG